MLCGLLLPCYSPAPFMLLLCSYSTPPQLQLLPCPCCTPALLLSSSNPAHSKLLPSPCSAPALFLPYSALLCLALLLPCSYPAPALLMLLPRSCFAPALLLPCSWSCQPQFGSLHHHHQHLMTFFGTARAAFCGTSSYLA